jgi:1-phosphofructokinase
MIYTCTLNPAIDYRLELDNLSEGELNRSKFSKFSIGGKGINVSLVLKELDTESISIGFAGGFTGNYILDFLNEKNIDNHFIEVNAPSRVNVKLLVGTRETEINQEGPTIDQTDIEKLLDYIEHLKKGDFLICAGSQGKIASNIYQTIAKKCFEKEINFIIDASNKVLLDTLKYQPLLIKPNIHELENYFDVEISSDSDTVLYAKKLLEKGAKNVIVSLGGDGSFLVTKKHIYRAKPIKGNVKNTVGAGDSMVAGFVSQIYKGESLLKAYQYAIAAGTATAFDYNLATHEGIHEYIENIKIMEVQNED